MEIKDYKEFLLQFFFGFTLFIMMTSALWHNVKNITLDTDNRTISFQNLFTRRIKLYNFSDFDGFIDTSIKHGRSGSSYATIGFVKGKKVLRRIDSYYYSNYEEIRSGLTNCNYLGQIKFGTWKSVKMLLNYDVLD